MRTESHPGVWILALVLAPFVASMLFWLIDDLVTRFRRPKGGPKRA